MLATGTTGTLEASPTETIDTIKLMLSLAAQLSSHNNGSSHQRTPTWAVVDPTLCRPAHKLISKSAVHQARLIMLGLQQQRCNSTNNKFSTTKVNRVVINTWPNKMHLPVEVEKQISLSLRSELHPWHKMLVEPSHKLTHLKTCMHPANNSSRRCLCKTTGNNNSSTNKLISIKLKDKVTANCQAVESQQKLPRKTPHLAALPAILTKGSQERTW